MEANFVIRAHGKTRFDHSKWALDVFAEAFKLAGSQTARRPPAHFVRDIDSPESPEVIRQHLLGQWHDQADCKQAALKDYDLSIRLLWSRQGSWINPVPAVIESYLQSAVPSWTWYFAHRGLDDFARYIGFSNYDALYGKTRSRDDRPKMSCWFSIKVDENTFVHRLGDYPAEDELSGGPKEVERLLTSPEKEPPKQGATYSGAIIVPQETKVIYWPRNFNDRQLRDAWKGWRIDQVTTGDGWFFQASIAQVPLKGQITRFREVCSALKEFNDGIFGRSDWRKFYDLTEKWLSKMPCEFSLSDKLAFGDRGESFNAYCYAKSYFEVNRNI
jgi:hypothetical protein